MPTLPEKSPETELETWQSIRARRRRRPAPAMTLNLVPMIDIVFLLLIYFLVATDFRLNEEFYRLDMPQRGGESQRDPFQLDEEPLHVFVTTLGTSADAYRVQVDGPYPQPEDFNALHEFLRARQVNATTRGGMFEPAHPIVIHASRSTRWDHAMEAFNAAARARYTNVTFAAAQ